MNGTGQPIGLQTIAIYAIIATLLIWRYSRPQRMSIGRMWITPVILLAITVLVIWSEQRIFPASPLFIVLALVVGAALGFPLGLLRAKHTDVRATQTPGIMYLDASWVVLAVWLGIFILRAGLRYVFHSGAQASIVGDGLLAFAASTIMVFYYTIYQKYRSLEVQAGRSRHKRGG